MSRNNEDRLGLGAPAPDVSPPPLVTSQQNEDLFSFVTPTEFIDLPSQGRYYAEGHPLHGKSSVEIKHMTAKEEDILTSESLLRKGIAIDRLLQSLIVDKSIKIDELLVGDKNALIIGARATGYGPHYETRVGCPVCTTQQSVNFDLDNLTVHHSEVPEEVHASENNTYFVVLPKCGLQVELRLLTGAQEKAYSEGTERKRKQKLPSSIATDLLRLMVVSVNGRTDAATINKFLEVLPIQDSVHIKSVYEKISPDVDLTHDFICVSCNHDGRVAVPLTAGFFWPKR